MITRIRRAWRQRPAPPFTTSTLQQEANRKLGFSAERTMSAAQRLFAEGVISLPPHRLDRAQRQGRWSEAGTAIRDLYGSEYHTGPRRYKTQVQNAQEAHEAIRPTDSPEHRSARAAWATTSDACTSSIWKRAVASQMADAQLLRTPLEITATGRMGRGLRRLR